MKCAPFTVNFDVAPNVNSFRAASVVSPLRDSREAVAGVNLPHAQRQLRFRFVVCGNADFRVLALLTDLGASRCTTASQASMRH